MSIRPATLADVPELVDLGVRFLRESRYAASLTENPEQMAITATRLIREDDAHVLVSEDRGGAMDGTIGLIRFRHPFSGLLTVNECFFFVEPGSRGSVGVRHLKAAETWSRAQQATQLNMVAPEGAARIEQLYRALKYQPVERAFALTL